MARVLGAVVLVVLASAVLAGCGDDVDCDSFNLDSAEFKRDITRIDLDRLTAAEQRSRVAALGLVQCGKLRGQAPEQVRALLGKPTRNNVDNNPRPHREYSYVVGFTPERGSDEEDTLFIEFDHGRVAYAAAPPRERGRYGGYKASKDGEPVGGGPRASGP